MQNENINFKYADFETVKNIALTFPNTEESISYEGTPSVKVRGKLMCRLHENGEFIAIRLDFAIRDKYLDSYPEIFICQTIIKPTHTFVCGHIIMTKNY